MKISSFISKNVYAIITNAYIFCKMIYNNKAINKGKKKGDLNYEI